ncbi:hypothetical protein [Streptomyces sp. DT2A-34]|uniref:hypothetical protein n=1 Tax=Streptomyces sp. DT2A-34 TaxID=3051182 RepID=UPI0034645CDF
MPRSIRQLIPEFDVRDAYIARPWIAVLIAPLGLAGYLLWVGNQMGDLGGYFTHQEGAWAHTFDYGEHTLDVLTGVAVGHVDYFFAYRYADTIGVLVVLLGLLLIPLLNRQRPPAVLTGYTLLTFALFLGSQQIFGNVSRYLFPAFPLFIPLAIPLSRLRLPMLCTLLGITAIASGSYSGFVLFRTRSHLRPWERLRSGRVGLVGRLVGDQQATCRVCTSSVLVLRRVARRAERSETRPAIAEWVSA